MLLNCLTIGPYVHLYWSLHIEYTHYFTTRTEWLSFLRDDSCFIGLQASPGMWMWWRKMEWLRTCSDFSLLHYMAFGNWDKKVECLNCFEHIYAISRGWIAHTSPYASDAWTYMGERIESVGVIRRNKKSVAFVGGKCWFDSGQTIFVQASMHVLWR